MSVQRYNFTSGGMYSHSDGTGKYVLHSDYEKLEKSVQDLKDSNWKLTNGLLYKLEEVDKQRDDLLATAKKTLPAIREYYKQAIKLDGYIPALETDIKNAEKGN